MSPFKTCSRGSSRWTRRLPAGSSSARASLGPQADSLPAAAAATRRARASDPLPAVPGSTERFLRSFPGSRLLSPDPPAMSRGAAPERSPRFGVLSWEQLQRLDSILAEPVPIHGRGNFPTLSVQPRHLVQVGRALQAGAPTERLFD